MVWCRYILIVVAMNIVTLGYAQRPRVVAFYNVENMMDTCDTPNFRDEDMLPLSDKEWGNERYRAKLGAIARVMGDIAQSYDYPSLVGLAEVETRGVLEDLLCQQPLLGRNYAICHYDSSDVRGIDVALLYRSDMFRVEESFVVRANVDFSTRDMLAVKGELCGEKVFVVVAHLPSRIRGEKFTAPNREACCRQMRKMVDSLAQSDPQRGVIVMGDMNDEPRNKSIALHLGARTNPRRLSSTDLYNPFAGCRGSSVYEGRWNCYDQIIVSSHFLDDKGIRLRGLGEVFKPDNLLDKNRHPLPTYRGVDYLGGVSDHLPVLIVME